MNKRIYPHLSSLTERVHGSASWATLDFSINTNPLGPPANVLEFVKKQDDLTWITKYPEIHASSLKERLGERLGISSEQLIIGNGAAELFFLLPRVLKINKGIIIHPTFGEYEPALMAANIPFERLYYQVEDYSFEFPMENLKEILEPGDLVYICRPNNPTGQMLKRQEFGELLKIAKERQAFLLIDESFIEFTKEPDGLIKYFHEDTPLILVRSLTKFYTIPGIRLGYLIAPAWLTKSLELARDPWSVNALSQQVGLAMLEDTNFYYRTREWVSQEKEWLYQELKSIKGLQVFPSETNFHLLRTQNQNIEQIYQYLRGKGIAIRLAGSFFGLDEQYFRLAVRTREENEQLLNELKAFLHREG